MTAPATCPGCSARIEASAVCCPICMRPRSRREIFKSLGSKTAGASRFPWGAARGVLWASIGVAVLCYGIRNAPPGSWARLLPGGADAAPAPRAPAPRAPAPPAPASLAPASLAPAPTSWRVYGGVYDLGDLSPVAGAALVFTDRSNGERHEKRADGRGRFSIELPLASDWGFDLKVGHARYDGVYLDDTEPSFRAQSAASRRDAISLTETSRIVHVPLQPPAGRDSLEHNIFLRPSRRPRR